MLLKACAGCGGRSEFVIEAAHCVRCSCEGCFEALQTRAVSEEVDRGAVRFNVGARLRVLGSQAVWVPRSQGGRTLAALTSRTRVETDSQGSAWILLHWRETPDAESSKWVSLRDKCNLLPLVVADDGLRHVAEQSLLHNRGLLALLWVARRLPGEQGEALRGLPAAPGPAGAGAAVAPAEVGPPGRRPQRPSCSGTRGTSVGFQPGLDAGRVEDVAAPAGSASRPPLLQGSSTRRWAAATRRGPGAQPPQQQRPAQRLEPVAGGRRPERPPMPACMARMRARASKSPARRPAAAPACTSRRTTHLA